MLQVPFITHKIGVFFVFFEHHTVYKKKNLIRSEVDIIFALWQAQNRKLFTKNLSLDVRQLADFTLGVTQ